MYIKCLIRMPMDSAQVQEMIVQNNPPWSSYSFMYHPCCLFCCFFLFLKKNKETDFQSEIFLLGMSAAGCGCKRLTRRDASRTTPCLHISLVLRQERDQTLPAARARTEVPEPRRSSSEKKDSQAFWLNRFNNATCKDFKKQEAD